MLEAILIGIAVCCVIAVAILGLLCSTPQFLDYWSRKDDPEWWKNYDEHIVEIEELKFGKNKWRDS